ncbi:arf-GAP with Rho-GAP domain, ANK repeat and PH domain-containing protein 1 isoform X1 [Gallus gallus]|uniref:arf-GAP with Rho-GAP domain, ANK repeat and PH domain-containing protein 1 isoform X1 n=1 Tax=Gallus gallus TaxID=9031 RepID=UPI001F004305|nr:arf-GAP with Rho-GAP domain, ANK repeat and PH domain-containing protein 1 isoform X1 [Gallus gallus]
MGPPEVRCGTGTGTPLPTKTPPPPPPPPDFDDSDYEDHCSPGTTPQAAVGRQQRLCSASSEEELPGDGQETHVGPTDPSADPTELLCTPIWAGWLDKMAPQGHYRYQRRWVTLDPQYLRYFDSDKDVFSKRFIPISSISRVAPIGEQKVEVLTQHRAFVFRADSDAERSQWLRVLQRAVAEQQERPPPPTWPHGDPPPGRPHCRRRHNPPFSFAAPSAASKQRWMAAMRGAVAAALSHSGVTDRIWGAEPNRSCADCGAQRPTWASINLCVVICQRCAGEHRAMGPNVSKVRSLEMDRRVWTEPLIQLLLRLHNGASNAFWAAHVPPSERIAARSSASERRRFLTAKYRHGKFRRFHPLYGQPEELNRALCMAVTTSDVAETQSLLFCGADVSCPTGDPKCPTPLDLAQRSGQRLQMEFLQHNRTSEPPCPDLGCAADRPYSRLLPSVTHCGFLYKTPSMAKALSERKGQEEFSRRWCALQDGVLSYYESDRSTAPNGHIRAPEIVCLAPNPPHSHGLECTFEVYTDSERLYLFGSDSPESAREWLRSIAQSFVPPCAEELLERHFDRLGRLMYKGGLSLETPQEGWFALVGSVLYVCSGDGERHEAVQLRKLQELSIQGDNEVLVLVERRR